MTVLSFLGISFSFCHCNRGSNNSVISVPSWHVCLFWSSRRRQLLCLGLLKDGVFSTFGSVGDVCSKWQALYTVPLRQQNKQVAIWKSETDIIPWWFVGPYESTPKQHLNQFSAAVDRIPCYAMWCDLKVTLQHLDRLDVSYAHFHAILLISSPKSGWSCLHFQFEAALTAYLNY